MFVLKDLQLAVALAVAFAVFAVATPVSPPYCPLHECQPGELSVL